MIDIEDHWAHKGHIGLHMDRKRRAGSSHRPVLFLVQGSSLSGRGSFDLQVPGHTDRSMTDRVVLDGFDVCGRDDPSTHEPSVVAALADHELAPTDRAPSGTDFGMAIHRPRVDPSRAACRVGMTRAEADGNATDAELLACFQKRPSRDQQLAMIEGTAHVAVPGIHRRRIGAVMRESFKLPEQNA